MIILGLDPGSVRFGYGVIRTDGLRVDYVAAGVISAPAGWDKYRRLGELGRELEGVLAEYRPDAAALEAGFVWGGRKGAEARRGGQQGAITSAAARGVAAYLCVARGISVTEYHAATVKKGAGGRGNATKEDVARVVMLRLGLRRMPDVDATDALAVAITHAQHARAQIAALERPTVH